MDDVCLSHSERTNPSIPQKGFSMTSFDLAGSVALVTGSTSGIGRATAILLGTRGAHVIVSGRDADRGNEVVDEIRSSGGKADFVPGDLHDAASAAALARQATETGGGHLDILVNNAGIASFGPTEATTEQAFDDTYALNVKGLYFLVAAVAPAMAARGKGAIVNVCSTAGLVGDPAMSLYGSSKAAVILLTKSWAAEFGPKGVRVNAISAGTTETPATKEHGGMLKQVAQAAPAKRVADPEEIAAAIVYLASDDASFVYGAILPVDGGVAAL